VWAAWTQGEEETRALAARLAAGLEPADVVALIGELGSGKTRFTEGACRALGYAGRVRSPTFVLVHVYRGRLPIYHFDLYRWELPGASAELAEWEEWMDGGGVSFVEWADRLGTALPERAILVRLAHAGGERRRVVVEAPPDRWARLRPHLPPGEEAGETATREAAGAPPPREEG